MARSATTFKPGQAPIPGAGRPKGTPNKKTLVLQERLAELKVDPVGTLAKILAEQMALFLLHKNKKRYGPAAEMLSDAERTASNLMQYLYPKKKAVEHSGEIGLFNFADFMALADKAPPIKDVTPGTDENE